MDAAPPRASRARQRSWPRAGDVALVVTLTVLVFLPGVFGEFVNWDDDRNFLLNLDYRGLGWDNLRWMLTTSHMGPWAPLSWLTLGADYLLWGLSPRGYHATSLLFHAATAAVFLLIARRLLGAALRFPAAAPPGSGPWQEGAARAGAVAAALVFAVHPLRVESVVWITERRDVVSGLFYMLTVLAYLRAVDGRGAAAPRRGAYWTSIACFAAAILSKSMVVTLPAVLLLLDGYPLGRLPAEGGWTGRATRRVIAEKLPFLALSAGGAAAAFVALRPWGTLLSLEDFGVGERVIVSLYGLAFYPWKTLVPLGLSPLYPLERPVDALAPPFLGALLVVVAITAVAAIGWRRRPWLAVTWGGYVVTALPVLGLFQNGPQLAADRYTYLATLGWALLAGAALARGIGGSTARPAGRLRAGACAAAAALVVIALAALASRQSLVWQESVTLWQHAVRLEPGSARARIYLGGALMGKGDFEAASKELERAVRLAPGDPEALIGWAAALAHSGRTTEAVAPAHAAATVRPADPEIHFQLGEVLTVAGHLDEALGAYREAARLRPRSPAAGYRVAATLAALGREREALAALEEARRVGRAADPSDPEAERAAALVLAYSDPARAVESWERYLALMARRRDPSLRDLAKVLEAIASIETLRQRQAARTVARP